MRPSANKRRLELCEKRQMSLPRVLPLYRCVLPAAKPVTSGLFKIVLLFSAEVFANAQQHRGRAQLHHHLPDAHQHSQPSSGSKVQRETELNKKDRSKFFRQFLQRFIKQLTRLGGQPRKESEYQQSVHENCGTKSNVSPPLPTTIMTRYYSDRFY